MALLPASLTARSIARTSRFLRALSAGRFAPEASAVIMMMTGNGEVDAVAAANNAASASAVGSPPPPAPASSKRSRILEKRRVAVGKKGKKSKRILDWGDGDGEGGDDTEGSRKTPHPGSYATPSQRERFGIRLPDDFANGGGASGGDGAETGSAAAAAAASVEGQPSPSLAREPPGGKRTKRKYALLFGYRGSGYGGFQMNEGQRTVQAELELALLRSGLLLPANFGHPWKYGWSVSGRTDKGVHAAGQVFSCKLEVVAPAEGGASGAAAALPGTPAEQQQKEAKQQEQQERATTEDDIRNLINGQLPPFMEILDVVRTTRNFCAKTQRHRARYQYLVPSFLLHEDLAGLFAPAVQDPSRADPALSREGVALLQSRLGGYRASPRQLDRLRGAVGEYRGTHAFHNFTRGVAPLEDRSRRYIEAFDVLDPVVLSGAEWIPATVVGQSFLLHQIRKMIGMAVRVARNPSAPSSSSGPSDAAAATATIEDLRNALSSPQSVRVPTAPAQGLFLDMSLYDGYNHRRGLMKQDQEVHLHDIAWGREDEDDDGEGSPYRERYRSFRDRIVEHIGREEKEEAHFLQYLYREHLGAVSLAAASAAGAAAPSHGQARPSSDSDEGSDDEPVRVDADPQRDDGMR